MRFIGRLHVHNCPPSDFWLGIVTFGESGSDEALIAWIPDELVVLVTQGINVIPEACLLWLEDEDGRPDWVGLELAVLMGDEAGGALHQLRCVACLSWFKSRDVEAPW
jgi:hypothetical protein